MPLTRIDIERLRKSPGTPNRLKKARLLAGLTQAEVATVLAIPQSALSDFERARFPNVRIETARKFSVFFGCAIEDLFPAVDAVAENEASK